MTTTTSNVWTTLFIDSEFGDQYNNVFLTELDALRSVADEMADWLEMYENYPDEALDRLAEKINECDYYAALEIWSDWQGEHGTGLQLSIEVHPLCTDIPLPPHCNRKVKA
jgi:hypothetical protein